MGSRCCTGQAAATVDHSLAVACCCCCCKAAHSHSSSDTARCCCCCYTSSQLLQAPAGFYTDHVQVIRAVDRTKEACSVAADAEVEGVMMKASSAKDSEDSHSTMMTMMNLREAHQHLPHSGDRSFPAVRNPLVGASDRPCGRSSNRPLSAFQLSYWLLGLAVALRHPNPQSGQSQSSRAEVQVQNEDCVR